MTQTLIKYILFLLTLSFAVPASPGAAEAKNSKKRITMSIFGLMIGTIGVVKPKSGLFVAVASDGTNRVQTSPDGFVWTARAAAEANYWHSVAYGNGMFVAVAGSGTNRVMTSPDGITWTARMAAEQNSWRCVVYGG